MAKKSRESRKREEIDNKNQRHKKRMEPSGKSRYALKQARAADQRITAERERRREQESYNVHAVRVQPAFPKSQDETRQRSFAERMLDGYFSGPFGAGRF